MHIRDIRISHILRPGTAREQARQEKRVHRSLFPTLRRAARYIPFSQDIIASWYCALDPKTPTASRGILLAALAYFVLPVDVVPDFILGLGFTDDAAVLLAAFSAVQQNIRPEHYIRARKVLTDGEGDKPASA